MKKSHPARWYCGGVLERSEWREEAMDLYTPIQTTVHLEPGDEVLMLRTAGGTIPCLVLRRERAEVVA